MNGVSMLVWTLALLALCGGEAAADWPTLAANPQRTSWVTEEVRGDVGAVWYRPVEPFVNYKVQVIAAEDKVFLATARGLYAFDADTGEQRWVHATATPLGHSPTYFEGKLYVGSYDRTIHAVDAATGQLAAGWQPYVALGGFEVSPLVVKTAAGVRVYAGSRDGYFYCLDGASGALVWRYKSGGPIRNSAAMDEGGVIYFAAEDLRAYALKDLGQNGQEIWRSDKLLGDTFASFWPVVYRDWVVFSGGMGYFYAPPYGHGEQLPWEEKDDIDADLTQSTGSEPGDWAPGTVTMDASPILDYYEAKPFRRRVFLLARKDGKEFTFDSDGDGKPEYAPFTFSGITQSGSKYPPIVGPDDVIYTDIDTVATKEQWTPSGALCGWKVGTKHISRVMDWGGKQQQAADEPMAFSGGGKLAYWALCCDREAGAFDVTIPFGQPNRWWGYWGYNGRFSIFPGYEPGYVADDMNGWGRFGHEQGIYGKHGATQNPWVPYKGKLFHHMGNAILAVAPGGSAQSPLPLATTVNVSDAVAVPLADDLKARLAEEIEKMIAAGHLKPGLFKSSIGDNSLSGNTPGGTQTHSFEMDHGIDYFSNPGETVIALLRALPHLPAELQQRTKDYVHGLYLEDNAESFPITRVTHVGFAEGKSRQGGEPPPDKLDAFTSFGKQTTVTNEWPWHFPLPSFYAAWKAAEVWPAEAGALYGALQDKLTLPPLLSDDQLIASPQMLNAYLAGYLGTLELAKLAGQPEPAQVRGEYDRLLALKIANFSVDAPNKVADTGGADHGNMIVFSRHFIHLVPEVAAELKKSRVAAMQELLDRVQVVEPYWFVGGYDTTFKEGTHQNLYEPTILAGYAAIAGPSYRELIRFLDAPVFPVGDLFYLQNLVAVIEAAGAEEQGHVNPDGGGTVLPGDGGPGGGEGGSGGDGAPGERARPEDGCGCALPAAGAGPAAALALLALALLAPARRGRRPRRR